MNKPITTALRNRIQRLILDMNNKQHLYETTGIAVTTLDRILKRGYAKDKQIDTLVNYCNQVEEKTAA